MSVCYLALVTHASVQKGIFDLTKGRFLIIRIVLNTQSVKIENKLSEKLKLGWNCRACFLSSVYRDTSNFYVCNSSKAWFHFHSLLQLHAGRREIATFHP